MFSVGQLLINEKTQELGIYGGFEFERDVRIILEKEILSSPTIFDEWTHIVHPDTNKPYAGKFVTENCLDSSFFGELNDFAVEKVREKWKEYTTLDFIPIIGTIYRREK